MRRSVVAQLLAFLCIQQSFWSLWNVSHDSTFDMKSSPGWTLSSALIAGRAWHGGVVKEKASELVFSWLSYFLI
jgi:hypothetical protein